MGGKKESEWGRTLRLAFKPIRKQIHKDLNHLAQKTQEIVGSVADVTIHESHRQQALRKRYGDFHRIYQDATSGNLKRESSGISILREIVGYGENQIPPKEFANLMWSEYGDAKARTYFEHWGK